MQIITASVLFASLLGTMAVGSAVPASFALHESVSAPHGYVNMGAAAADMTLNLRLGLVSADFATLETRLYEASTPSSSKYGQHLSAAEVRTLARILNASSLTACAGQIVHGAAG
jgi:tripeptidyl-peptidase-1